MGVPDRLADRGAAGVNLRKATVSAGWAYGAGDTATIIPIKLDGVGDDMQAGTVATYAPTVGDWVWVLVDPGRMVIIGRIG